MKLMTLIIFLSHTSGTLGDVKSSLFKTKPGIKLSENSIWSPARSKVHCIQLCLSTVNCCVASYFPDTKMCFLDNSQNCCPKTEQDNGAIGIFRHSSLVGSYQCESIAYNSSRYVIVKKSVTWQEAVQICESDGGILCEIETEEENNFLKRELQSPLNNGSVYFIGGYNFNRDNTLEWISRPNEKPIFTDMHDKEPSDPDNEFCLAMYQPASYEWVDISCDWPSYFICEYQACNGQ